MKIYLKTHKSLRSPETTTKNELVKKNKSWSLKNTNSRHSVTLSIKNNNE